MLPLQENSEGGEGLSVCDQIRLLGGLEDGREGLRLRLAVIGGEGLTFLQGL